MPHLAPLNWLLMPMMLWLLFIWFSSSFWWTAPPYLKSLPTPQTTNQNTWKWV